jgi:hypothetical protein
MHAFRDDRDLGSVAPDRSGCEAGPHDSEGYVLPTFDRTIPLGSVKGATKAALAVIAAVERD